MLYASFNIKNIWNKRQNYNNVFFWHKRIAKNKSIEFQIIDDNDILFKVELEIAFRGKDHAGPSLVLGLFGVELSLQIYDHRHWDYASNRWNDTHKQNLDGF